MSRRGRKEGSSSGHDSANVAVHSGEEEENKELSERMESERKEARKKELEDEMAGDLDKQWNEVARQRKLKAEVRSFNNKVASIC